MSIVPRFSPQRINLYNDPFSLRTWDPFKDYHVSISGGTTGGFFNSRIDWEDTPDAHVFRTDLPGLRKEEVRVQVDEEEKVLKITGERTEVREKKVKDGNWHRLEQRSGQFTRIFRLPENARTDQATAWMAEGVLSVIVPKGEPKKTHLRTVHIS